MNKRLIAFIVLFALFLPAAGHAVDLVLHDVPARVYFSPDGGATQAIVREIDNATLEALVQAYSFTSAPIAKALVDAHRRGVSVEVVLDKSQRTEKYSGATFLANNRIPTCIDAAHAIAHNNKIMIIDKQTVITGSFNFTKAAEEKNAENLLIIRSKELASYYLENWQRHRQHSEPYPGRY
jgi:phosphatidylserine/phosphatidylglycerophosphate/cardiolipin synthase-like enzyme